jgi:hypothetical protein
MTEPHFYWISVWGAQARRWCEALERLSPNDVREYLHQRLLSGSAGDIKFGQVSVPSGFVEEWLKSYDQSQAHAVELSRNETATLAKEANNLAKEANDLARSANNVARKNNIIAALALVVAVIALAVSIFLKSH